jgi:hypothetical protein
MTSPATTDRPGLAHATTLITAGLAEAIHGGCEVIVSRTELKG